MRPRLAILDALRDLLDHAVALLVIQHPEIADNEGLAGLPPQAWVADHLASAMRDLQRVLLRYREAVTDDARHCSRAPPAHHPDALAVSPSLMAIAQVERDPISHRGTCAATTRRCAYRGYCAASSRMRCAPGASWSALRDAYLSEERATLTSAHARR